MHNITNQNFIKNLPLLLSNAVESSDKSVLPVKYFNRNSQTTSGPQMEPIDQILMITSYPPRQCGIASYSQDLRNSIQEKFGHSLEVKICALEEANPEHEFPAEVDMTLITSNPENYFQLADKINQKKDYKIVFIQHEFGLYGGDSGVYVLDLMEKLDKPIVATLHTVLPFPNKNQKEVLSKIGKLSDALIVMTHNAAQILEQTYSVSKEKIHVIPHGTHLISPYSEHDKNIKHSFGKRLVLSSFGLLNAGKSIETALDALPAVIKEFPNLLYLIIGKTHPGVAKVEGEKYRNSLYEKVKQLNLVENVLFVNKYLAIESLLAYLRRTDIYLFTSKDPYQAVSGTLAYAISSGCPIISTPIPHAKEFLDGAGLVVNFQAPAELSEAIISLLSNPKRMHEMSLNALQRISPTAWQNSAIAHVDLLSQHIKTPIQLKYEFPKISLSHINRLTTDTAMVQFSSISKPDIETGYTLDDNARALIAVSKHYQFTGDITDLRLIDTYLNFLVFCQQPDGRFLNYVDKNGLFLKKNHLENLEDSNGRAIWALGEFLALDDLFQRDHVALAEKAMEGYLRHIPNLQSPRAIAFVIKGLHLYNQSKKEPKINDLITSLADNLVSKYKGVSDNKWKWFEEYLTYGNSVLPEAMLCAYLSTGNGLFKTVALSTFHYLLAIIFTETEIKVVSNQGWLEKGKSANVYGEQPIDVAYTIVALGLFYDTFKKQSYLDKMEIAFNWFLGQNHLRQIIYNPCTGGCYDGLEKYQVNLNQGAESTVSYLLSRLTVQKYLGLPSQRMHDVKKDMPAFAYNM